MDTLRGNFETPEADHDYYAGDDDTGRESPPSAIGTDERRMQVRAYNHWASLLEDRSFPPIEALDPEQLPDFSPYSVLLDFTAGIENPGITYLGRELAAECGIAPAELQQLHDVPARSLLSRITDHYMQILANEAPIGFEAEFVNQRGATILYRGILLPFSSDDQTIDFIYGVINWKELADQQTSDELLLQVDQVLDQAIGAEATSADLADGEAREGWADGPGDANDDLEVKGDTAMEQPLDVSHEDGDEDEAPFDYAARFNLNYYDDSDDEEGEDEDEEDSGLPRPSFGSLTSIGGGIRKSEPRLAVLPEVPAAERLAEMDLGTESFDNDFGTEPFEDGPALSDANGAAMPSADPLGPVVAGDSAAFLPEPLDIAEPDGAGEGVDGPALPAIDPADMELGDWLAVAREMAATARSSEDRTRTALYEAIGRAYDFSIAAEEAPEDFAEIVADSGLTTQDRAPMTPIVKLVFGADYDKTRLTEYAAALSHARRLDLPRGALGDFLRQTDGGLKAVVQAERRLRRIESGKAVEEDPGEVLAARLRDLPAIGLADIDPSGAEFGLLMIRRSADGGIEIMGEVPEDTGLLERAARKLLG